MRTPLALAVAAVVLLTGSAHAEVFTARDALHLSLRRSAVTLATDSELDVTSKGINARYGIKRSSRTGPFDYREVTVLGEPYDLQDADGGKWRLWVRSVVGRVLVVELVRALPQRPQFTERYQVSSLSINGEEASPTFPPLVLQADGAYQLGGVNGHYKRSEIGVTLDGVPAHFGIGRYWANRDGLTFTYRLGKNTFEVKYQLSPNLAGL